jgi:hypothetical protein
MVSMNVCQIFETIAARVKSLHVSASVFTLKYFLSTFRYVLERQGWPLCYSFKNNYVERLARQTRIFVKRLGLLSP